MKSFKKIALALVAAMTMGSLVATPASATTMSVVLKVNGATNTTASAIATPALLPVPADNKVDAADALEVEATVATGTSVSVTATNATIVTALHTTTAPVSASSGSTSLTVATGTGNKATFYVYTKTTAVGSIVVTNGGTTFTYYVQGQAGNVNTLTVTAPANGAAGTKQTITVEATDVFGNKKSGIQVTGRVFGSGGTLDTATVTTGATLSTFGKSDFGLTLPATGATRSLVEFSLTNSADAAVKVDGLTAPTLAPYAEIAIRDLASELAAEKAARAADKAAADKAAADAKSLADKALADAKAAADAAALKAAADLATANAEIASLKAAAVTAKAAADKALADATAAHAAELAKVKADNASAVSAMKKAFNSLAKKWNKANPKAKVALVK